MIINMVRKPVILFETIAMICRYYRSDSYTANASRLMDLFGAVLSPSQISDLWHNAKLAEEIMDSVCADIDFANEDFKFFFKPFDTGEINERNCIAKVLVFSMLQIKPVSFDEAIEQVKNDWNEAKREGLEILNYHMHGLNFLTATADAPPPTLFEQLYSLDYPHQAKMDTFLALNQHELYIDRLAKLIRPYAERLEAVIDERLANIFAVSADYWERNLASMSVEQVTALMRIDPKTQLKMLARAYVSFFLFNELGNSFDDLSSPSPDDITTICIGIAVYPEYTAVLTEKSVDNIAEALKALADPVRVEMLARMFKNRDYCFNISNDMDLNPGNVSRHLTTLYENGFLDRERGDGRVYFKTNFDAIVRAVQNFLSYIKD
ncbi:MAG: winged helix-turn-helix transcriptional regulator [Clostridia bacterium]|nr:winged helix-turn-helix transcriptional regulator [Clostridia bacterium]